MEQGLRALRLLEGYLPAEWLEALRRLPPGEGARLEEIRLRAHQPVMVTVAGKNRILRAEPPLLCLPETLERVFLAACEYSPASRAEQIRQGYVLLRGGLRMGLGGRCLPDRGEVGNISPITAANIRILREMEGVGLPVVRQLRRPGGLESALILAPPGGGKTTLLRDIVRILSDGADGGPGLRVGVVDERGELAGCVQGVPTLRIGRQSDVLDGCPKARGMMLMIRSLNPQVIAVDELGSAEDAAAVAEAVRCGVAVLATAHGAGLEDLERPLLKPLWQSGLFRRAVVLGAIPGSRAEVHPWTP